MTAIDFVPLLKAPQSWPTVVTATVAMGALAGLDIAGAIAAKEWSVNGSNAAAAIGVTSFVLLFWVYASALQYAELAVVTMGWIVLLQVGLLVIDSVRYGVQHSTGQWVAVVVIMAAQGYLVLSPSPATG